MRFFFFPLGISTVSLPYYPPIWAAGLLLLSLLIAAPASGDPPADRTELLLEEASRHQWSPDQLFEALDLHDRPTCADFSDRSYLRERRQRWREAIELIALHDPRALSRWLIGLDEPPSLVKQESTDQLHCLIGDLLDHVAHSDSSIRLFPDYDRLFSGHFDGPTDLARTALDEPAWKRRVIDHFTRSHHRPFHSQTHIWRRKFQFTGRPFLRITAYSAERCDLPVHHGWQPDDEQHQRCWHHQLDADQRQREILQASAGPGLSRHHWGTDIDIFRLLTPWVYHEGGAFHADWQWLDAHALDRGLFQTYDGQSRNGFSHMEEPWHWSYYPIAQALLSYIEDHPQWFKDHLDNHWSRLERQWGGDHFSHLRDHWRDYLFNIQRPSYEARPAPRDTSFPLEIAR